MTEATEDVKVKKGDRFWAMGCLAEVQRVGKTWADLKVTQPPGGANWSKRQPLPFPADWERVEPVKTYGSPVLDWTIHPGVHWREIVLLSERSQAEIAKEMGISEKHLSQILTCTAMPGVEATVAFSRVMEVSVTLMWNLACNHKLALALGKKDLTSEHL